MICDDEGLAEVRTRLAVLGVFDQKVTDVPDPLGVQLSHFWEGANRRGINDLA